MGERKRWLFERRQNRSVKPRQADPRVTSDAGAEGIVRFTRGAIRKGRSLACHLDVRIDASPVEGRTFDALDDGGASFLGRIKRGLSAASFDANEASLLARLPAFNLAGIVRGELEAGSGCGWDLKRVQRTVLKAGARLVEHGRRLIVDVAQAAGVLWGRLPDRVRRSWQKASWGPDAAGRRRGPRPRPWVAPPAHARLHLVLRE